TRFITYIPQKVMSQGGGNMAKYISNKTHNQKDHADHQLTPQKSSYSQPYSKYTKTYPTEHLNSSSKTNSHTPPTFPQSSTGSKN
ncbi:MAG: hypothetical protein NZM36_02215, partial [Aquificaceae bacterium]|nr:hypothetical protein [Aquificaceae bacterium]